MHTCVRWFHFFSFFGVCHVLRLDVVLFTEVVSGLVRTTRKFRAEQAVPRGRSRSCQRGGSARVNTLGAPAVAKQTKPIHSDSLQVQVEPVVPRP